MSRDPASLFPVAIAHAARLAAGGDPTAATELLAAIPVDHAAHPAAIDLRARIAAQQGDHAAARAHWDNLLRMDPSNAGAARGLAALNRGHLWWWKARWALALALVATIGWLVLRPEKGAAPQAAAAAPALPAATPTPVPDARPADLAPWEGVPISVDGILVDRGRGSMSLRFERGLFQRGTAFAPGALQTVDALADQIASRADQLAVTVIGHADRRPVRDNPWITDNVHLGVLRATSVAELLRLRAGVPADAITIRSAGAADPPFPDQSGADLIRNRTVVVTLSPRDPRP